MPGAYLLMNWVTRLLLPAIACAAMAQASADEGAITRQLEDLLASAEAEGASGTLRISRHGLVVFESGYGSASCSDNTPVNSGHVFMIGSITKEFTRLMAYVLEERGVLSRSDALGDWLSGFDMPVAQVTLQQVMDHQAGLPDLIDENGQPVTYSIEYDYVPVTRDELIARARLARLVHEPGTTEQYSNLGYQLLAAVYEVATGETYPALLRRYIYEPAGMTATDFWFEDRSPGRFVDGCWSGGERWGNPITDGMWDEAGPSWNLIGAGGLLSTAESLGKFFEGIGDGVYFESDEQMQQYKTDRMVFSERRQQLVMGPAGSNGIFNAVAVWRDGDGVSIVLFSNRADHPGERQLIRDIAGLVR